MKNKSIKVVWTNHAILALDYHCGIIALDSPSNAKNVKKELIKISKELSSFPE